MSEEPWWRVVDNITIHNKRRRSCDTGWVKKGSDDEGEWWGREVVKKGSDDDGEWWRREVVTKGSGEEGKWWGWEVVKKGSGDEGKWWGREMVQKGSGEEGKWWRREVMMKGSGDEGKWWRRGVVTKGKFYAFLEVVVADRIGMAAWMLHGLCFGEEAGARNLVFFRVKWLQPAMKGTSCVRRLRLRSFGSFYVFCNNGVSCVCSSMRFLKLWLRIALEWVHECYMLCVVGRKPEHETLCFSV